MLHLPNGRQRHHTGRTIPLCVGLGACDQVWQMMRFAQGCDSRYYGGRIISRKTYTHTTAKKDNAPLECNDGDDAK